MEFRTYQNPVISGFNPDPSICRVGKDFYLVNSSFEFYPGIPVYHSTNLVNWEHDGYILDRPELLNLEGCRPSGGLYAPTIRYQVLQKESEPAAGWFFMTVTNVSGRGHFIVHSRSIHGSWSSPVTVDQPGIDPSLFWDDDGRCWYTSTGTDSKGTACILVSEVDPMTGHRLSEIRVLAYGTESRNVEAPHLYKIGRFYYLMTAEGGTEYGHRETIRRARYVLGPYESCPHGAILSHKDDPDTSISCAGHGDLVCDTNGNWWMVCLGIRPSSSAEGRVMLHHLGRETFLAPVVWDEQGWPVVGNDILWRKLTERFRDNEPGEKNGHAQHRVVIPSEKSPARISPQDAAEKRSTGDNFPEFMEAQPHRVQGQLARTVMAPLPGEPVEPVDRSFDDRFGNPVWPDPWNWLRNPDMKNYHRAVRVEQDGTILMGDFPNTPEENNSQGSSTGLLLEGTDVTLNDQGSPTWVGVRQKEFNILAETVLRPVVRKAETPDRNYRAGLTVFYNKDYHYDLAVMQLHGEWVVTLAKHVHDIWTVTAMRKIVPGRNGDVFLRVAADREAYRFLYSTDGQQYAMLGTGVTAGLATEGTMTMTFTGVYIGLFAEHGDVLFGRFRCVTLEDA